MPINMFILTKSKHHQLKNGVLLFFKALCQIGLMSPNIEIKQP